MKRSSRKNKSSSKGKSPFSPGRENKANVEALIAFGRSYPRTPGLVSIPRTLMPSALRTVLRYSTNVTMTSTSGAIVSFLVSGNGPFNPDSGSGQPIGFDQLMSLYLRYRCIASSIEVSLANVGATNPAANGDIVIYPTVDGAAEATLTAATSQSYAVRRSGNFAYNMNGGRPLESHMSTALLFGVPKQAILVDDALAGTASANPTQVWDWVISLESADATTTSVYYVEITVSYLCDFFKLSQIAQSVDSPLSVFSSAAPPSVSDGNRGSLSSSVLGKLEKFLSDRQPQGTPLAVKDELAGNRGSASTQDVNNTSAFLESRLASMRR